MRLPMYLDWRNVYRLPSRRYSAVNCLRHTPALLVPFRYLSRASPGGGIGACVAHLHKSVS